ncbi:MAG: ribonuclease D [Pseudohongiellaceae bacterium]
MQADDKTVVYVNSQAAFDDCLATLAQSSLLAMDTEFERERTFYPKMGLLQLADEHSCYLIDPQAIPNWKQPFTALLQTPTIHFILHAASEDLNLLLCTLNCLPRKLIDTQLAAALLGEGYSLGYRALVETFFGVTLDKGETRSNWLKRPLTEKQLLYAALDVVYLHRLWQQFAERLQEKGDNRLAWLDEECNRMLGTATASESSERWEEMYAEIGGAWTLSDAELRTLQRLCNWRETIAREKDLPRYWICKDNDLIGLTRLHHQQPDAEITERFVEEHLTEGSPDIDRRFLRRYGKTINKLLAAADETLKPVDRSLLKPPTPKAMRSTLKSSLKSCQQVVAERGEVLGIAPELLGSKRHLLQLLHQLNNRGMQAWPGVFAGWRAEVLADKLLPILQKVSEKQ